MSVRFFSLLAGFVMIVPVASFAANSNEQTISTLQAQIQALQQQIQSLIQNRPSVDDRPGDEPSQISVISFDRDLYYGLRNDSDVSNLQEFLIDQGFLKGVSSGNYFLLTQKAVQEFQSVHGLKPTGYFGPLTRAIANKILAGTGSGGNGGGMARAGYLSIDPSRIELKVGGSQRIRAIFIPSRPACLDSTPACEIAELAPYEVDALFVSNDSSVATIVVAVPSCAAPPPGQLFSCPKGFYSVQGVSVGKTFVTASYNNGVDTFTAQMNVGVNNEGSVDNGSLYFTPPSAQLKVGESNAIKVFYQPPMPPCPSGLACILAFPAPQDVTGDLSGIFSSDSSVAEVVEVAIQCVRAPCEGNQMLVRGVSPGKAVISASYIAVNGNKYSARMDAAVSRVAGNNLPPVISGLKGPNVLRVSETGTWTIQASDPENGSLAYHITWGDEEIGIPRASQVSLAVDRITQTATFTHSYRKAGTFKPLFVVVDAAGLSAQTSASVVVGIMQSLTVLTPNGGETWTKGSTQTIKWQDNNSTTSSCPVGVYCNSLTPIAPRYYDITLAPYYPPCTGLICPAYPYIMPYIITKGVYGFSYNWPVANILNTGGIAPDGSYTIQICQTGSTMCDSSDDYFKIVSGSIYINNPPTINGIPAIPSDIKVNQSVSFAWGATDTDGDSLSWSVSWGDGMGISTACIGTTPIAVNSSTSVSKSQSGSWEFKQTHTWAKVGTYPVKVTADDCKGGSDVHTFNVTVTEADIRSIMLLSPNGGEMWRPGEVHRIAWNASGVAFVKIYIYDSNISGSGSTHYITPNNSSIAASAGYYDWTIPPFNQLPPFNGNGSSNYKIRIDDASDANLLYSDHSDAPFSITSSVSANGIDFRIENVQLPASTNIDKETMLTFDIINRGNETFYWQKYGRGVQWTVDFLSAVNGYDTVGRIISDGCNTSVELVPGAGCRVSIGYTFKSVGLKTLPITVDYANQVPEIDESNNTIKSTITVSALN